MNYKDKKKLTNNCKKIVTKKIIYCMSFYLPQVITANATLSKSLCLKYLRFNL